MCLWSISFKLFRETNISELIEKEVWILDAKYIQEISRLVVLADSRQIVFVDLFSIKPRLISTISKLENNPLCLVVATDFQPNLDIIIFGGFNYF